MKTLINWITLLVISFASVVLIGLWARLVVTLFCIGYGC
jgi:hypothetical protein